MKPVQKMSLVVAVLAFTLASPAAWAAEAVAAEAPAVAAEPLFLPEAIEQVTCTRCLGFHTTSPGGGAASHWGMGSTCAAATADLNAQLWGAADDGCFNNSNSSACSLTVVVTGACWWSPVYNKYVVDGYGNYKCEVYIC